MYDFLLALLSFLGLIFGIVLPALLLLYSAYKQRPRLSALAFAIGITLGLGIHFEYLPKSYGPQTFHFSFWEGVAIAFIPIAIPVIITFFVVRFIGKQRKVPRANSFAFLDLKIISTFLALVLLTSPLMFWGYSQVEKNIPDYSKYVDIDLKITADNFYYHSDPDGTGTLAKVLTAEERLNITLPETLRNIYQIRDGGRAVRLYLPNVENPERTLIYWHPILGSASKTSRSPYGILRSTKQLIFATDFFNSPHPLEAHEAAQKWLLLINDRTQMMFLDYNDETSPRLGLYDKQLDISETNPVFFDSFDIFLDAVRKEH